ncbi:MAG: hydrogenase 4 subunit F, partial [Anaerolineae bacterium]|nr:hydrogenase 4 subunit F [Anaerolineae bacterium]
MTDEAKLIWLLLIPLIFSFVPFVARWRRENSRQIIEAAHVLSISLVLLLSLLTVNTVSDSKQVFALGSWLHVDDLSAIFLLIIGTVGFLVGIYSLGYTRHDLETGELDSRQLSTYYSLFSLFLFSMLLVVTANNII